MSGIDDKTTINDKELEVMSDILSQVSDEILDKHMANVIGMGIGVKETNGESTDEPAFIFLVTKKIKKHLLDEKDLVPSKIFGIKTDVREVGQVRIRQVNQEERLPALPDRIRPVMGGVQCRAHQYHSWNYSNLRL